MIDYKELYLTLMRKTEKAIRILEEAQRECEEMYLTAGDTAEEAEGIPDHPEV